RGRRAPGAHDDLELAVVLEISDGQRSELAAAAEWISRPDRGAEPVVDRQLIRIAPDDDLERSIAGQVGDRDAGPHAPRARRAPLEAASCAVERDDVVRAPDHVGLSVAVEVGDRGRRVANGLTRGTSVSSA